MDSPPSYFAVLPAGVRYDKNLTHLEKILFAEITALTNRYGYCIASNEYFSLLYGNSTRTISRAISHLSKLGYLLLFQETKDNKTLRKIYLAESMTTPLISKNVKEGVDNSV